ncbi:M23 family metallopeptidase [Cohnella thermotolerans]|uniref:M23 family metallopeptidase n=1 Tax=Cohnella thermotolerans TaxID=329858 RepID=UPI000404B091|nr:M23 family metallopeptidase [Cohnella thermotolerans]
MQVRNNVRQRRRDRIQQLTGARSEGWRGAPEPPHDFAGEAAAPEFGMPEAVSQDGEFGRQAGPGGGAEAGPPIDTLRPEEGVDSLAGMDELFDTRQERPIPPAQSRIPAYRGPLADTEPDPEKWWKEKQRQERSRTSHTGLRDSLVPAGPPPAASPDPRLRSLWESASPSGSKPPGKGPIGSLPNLSSFGGLAGPPTWDDGPPGGSSGPFLSRIFRGLTMRLAVAAVLFGAVWGWLRLELPGNELVRGWTVRAVTEDMDFTAVEAWYERTFEGSSSFLPIFKQQDETQAVSAEWSREVTVPPLAGRILQTFAQDGEGIRLAAPAGTPVKAAHTGRVAEVTLDAKGLATIAIQHANGVETVYGNVDNAAVKKNDWVEVGRTLGELASSTSDGKGEGTLFFAVKQNGKTLDPAEVVPFD